jgi:hypothetical protein
MKDCCEVTADYTARQRRGLGEPRRCYYAAAEAGIGRELNGTSRMRSVSALARNAITAAETNALV